MTQPFDHSGKHVFVSGGTSGINLGVAQAYAQAGARVTVLSRKIDKVEAAVATLKALGPDAQGFAGDVRDVGRLETVFAEAAATFGEIDVLISGAAGNFPAPALGISPNGFKSVVDIDLLGTFHVVKSAFPHLKKPGGVITNISAPQAYIPMDFQMHVCAAKAGVDMITRVGALEWGELGLRVNSVVPGPIEDTEGMERLAPTAEAKEAARQSVPLGRYGTKSDIANACMFLSSPYATYISGVVLPVDGGWSLGGVAAMSAGMKKMMMGR
ncbi:SDR family oxidoreductase [Oleomonas cavernae]|uniref:SDR family oxidoreductase n=1 Tax=Oleomonas cavernae TaxID=2320859 RepID=A0A418WTN6_9PROT|nr:SDR family oxidoreductase [Oleomonas cavernae]RJF94536.1 SDR family oxidoreductase [Oleomonas cavernae]